MSEQCWCSTATAGDARHVLRVSGEHHAERLRFAGHGPQPLPLHSEVQAFVERHNNVIILEINRDAQLYGIMRKEYPNHLLEKMHSVAYSDGMPPRARLYAERILEVLKEVGA